MSRFSLQDVLDSTGAVLMRGGPRGGGTGAAGVAITGVSTDTRALEEGEFFLALSGPNFDGNRFAAGAIVSGACALLLRDDEAARSAVSSLAGNIPILLHPDPRRALADLAGWYRSTFEAPVVGITGSCGKTTTKDILGQLLRPLFPVVASPSSFNNEIGVPLTLLMAERDTELFAVEMGTNHTGEIAALCRIARPTAGVITNIGAAHLEGLGSLDGVAREKGDLAAALPREGFLVLNADCRFATELRSRTAARVITFSVEGRGPDRGDLNATDLYFHAGGTTFRLNGREVTSPLLGTHNVQNLLAALCVCSGLSVPIDHVLPAIAGMTGGPQRMERIELGELTVFDDTWNSNPDSLRAAVRVLAGLHGFQRRILVLGDMLELGDLAAELHHRLGREAATGGVDRLILVGELAKAAAAGALEGGLAPDHVIHVPNTEEAISVVAHVVADGDVVLVKGSRRLRLEAVVEHLKQRCEAN